MGCDARPLLIVLLSVLCVSALAGEPEALVSIRDACEKARRRVEEKGKRNAAAADVWYGERLAGIETQYQARGDLNGVLTVRTERKRFATEGTVPDPDSGNAVPAIRDARAEHARRARAAEEEQRHDLAKLSKAYVERLEVLKRELTQQNRIRDALLVSKELEAARFAAEAAAATVADASEPKDPKVACERCGGQGHTLEICPVCRGGRKCPACLGRGRRVSRLKGNRQWVACMRCRGTGRCRRCDGKGKVEEPCPACGGEGRLTPGEGNASP
jgi:hypothetical protein